MTARTRGRPQGPSGTREAIQAEARRQFADLGYAATTLRGIAHGAGVDARLVLHYFGSKKELFVTTVELPVDPERLVEAVFESGPDGVAQRAAEFMLTVLDDPESQGAFTGLLRAAVSEPDAAEIIRGMLAERLLVPIATRVGGDQPDLRASMVASVVLGLVVGRKIVAIRPLAQADREQLLRALTPVIQHYLTGDWVSGPDRDDRPERQDQAARPKSLS
ncbi:MAG: TetR family transcriptional regulator [Chloroflexota bacterium]